MKISLTRLIGLSAVVLAAAVSAADVLFPQRRHRTRTGVAPLGRRGMPPPNRQSPRQTAKQACHSTGSCPQ
jgi:hypothetical protein